MPLRCLLGGHRYVVQSDPAGEECVRCGHAKRDKRSPDSAIPEHKRNQRGDPYPGASGPADEHCSSRLGASSAGKNDPARTFKILTVMSPVAGRRGNELVAGAVAQLASLR